MFCVAHMLWIISENPCLVYGVPAKITYGNVIVVFKRQINNCTVIGDGNFVKIYISPDMEVVAYEYQWDDIVEAGNGFAMDRESSNANIAADSERIYLCSNRYDANREIKPAYLIHHNDNIYEIRCVLSGKVLFRNTQ